ncbi:MAG: nitroreductase family protein, partial [Dehalococcoidia bacterium]
MPAGIDLFEAIDTQRGIRHIRPDPVPDDLIDRLLRAAIKAPSGGVNQGWGFIVIRDQQIRHKIGD